MLRRTAEIKIPEIVSEALYFQKINTLAIFHCSRCLIISNNPVPPRSALAPARTSEPTQTEMHYWSKVFKVRE